MLTRPTLDQMATLGLNGMAAAWRALAEQDPGEALDRNEWLGLMLDREAAWRADKRFANRLRNAKMRFPNACVEGINFAAPVASIVARFCHSPKEDGSRPMNRSFSPGLPAPERPGWPVPSPIRPRAWINPSPTPACLVSLKTWQWPASMAASQG